MTNKKLKVLIIAHELSPSSGSECAVGWNLVTRIASFHSVTVLYAGGSQARPHSYKSAIEKYFQDNPAITDLGLISVDQPLFTRITSLLNRLFHKIGPIGLPLLYYLGYRSWQKSAFSAAYEMHKTLGFDVVHQLTQITYREPGFTWKLGIPFFWGPTGGIANMPWHFYKNLPIGSKIIEAIRYFSNKYQSSCMGRIRKAISRSSVIYTYSKEDARFFQTFSSGRIRLMLDVGTTRSADMLKNDNRFEEIIECVWCGQLAYRKAPEIAIRALAAGEITMKKVRLTIIGDGPLEKRLLDLARHLQVQNIRWIRKIPHHEVFDIMRQSDLLIHTSLREATSSVIPEALSVGLPVICHDINGMGIAVNEHCGIKIPMVSPEASVRDFHFALKSLVLDRAYLGRLKKGALERASELSWDNMAKIIAYDYSEMTIA